MRQVPQALLDRAKELRQSQTTTEEILWECLRDRRLNGFKFRRQHNIGQYIADFYCHEAKLVIEIDGEIHQIQRERDAERDKWMQDHKLTILRLQNHQIQNDLHNSLQTILSNLLPPSPQPSNLLPPSPQGEGLGVRANTLRALTWDASQPITDFPTIFAANAFAMPQSALKADGWRLENTQVLDLLAKLRSAGKPLGEYVNGKFYRGILTGFNEAFVIDRATRDKLIAEHLSSAEVIKPLLRGRDVKRWFVDYQDLYLIKIESSENKTHPWSNKLENEAEEIFNQTYPAIHKHFEQFRSQLIARADQGKFFWELRSCKYWEEFEKPKIIYPNICKRNEFSWDESGYYTNQKAFIIPCNDKTLLAILNSSVMTFLFDKLLPKLQGDFYEPSSIFMKDFPIPTATEAEQKAIETLVQKCLDAKGQNAAGVTRGVKKYM